jgi:Fe-S cluster biogenesis protein NfuA
MTHTPDPDFTSKLQRLEALVQQAERLPDPAARSQARELVQALLDLHGVGLARLLEHVAAAGAAGAAILDGCAADEVVSGLLLLHGLHPLGLEERARQAVEQLRPLLGSHGGTAELLGVEDGVVRLRVEAGCGCGSSAAAVRRAVEEAISATAPDALAVEIEGLGEAAEGRVALPML